MQSETKYMNIEGDVDMDVLDVEKVIICDNHNTIHISLDSA